MQLRILDGDEVRRALPMGVAISAMKRAFSQIASEQVTMPLRTQIEVTAHDGVALFMPAYAAASEALTVKAVSVYPGNVAHGLPTIHGVVLVVEAATGRPLALLEGSSLTAIRTGAASGAATDLLARPAARIVTIIGAGVQARTQLEAVCTVRRIEQVRVFSRDRAQAVAFAHELSGTGQIPHQIIVADDANAAVEGADIICTATTSDTPVFSAAALAPGCHINAIGAYRTDMRELDTETVRRSRLVVDDRAAALAEAGDIVIPLEEGAIDESHIYATLGEIANGQKQGRNDDDQITIFKSVGLAVQDAVAASVALERASAERLGQIVTL